MNLYKLPIIDKYTCLEKMSEFFIMEEKPPVIFCDINSKKELIDNFIKYYDVNIKDDFAGTVFDRAVIYSEEEFSLALFAFPLLAEKKPLFISLKNLEKRMGFSCNNIITIGSAEFSGSNYHLKTKEDILKFSGKKDFSALIVINSEDSSSSMTEDCLSTEYKCPFLSILGSYIGAIRDGLIYDVSSSSICGNNIEKCINTMYGENISKIISIGTPGSLPFVKSEIPDFVLGNSYKTDVIRDYTIWNSSFVNSSHGRILGLNILDCSLLFQRSFLNKYLRNIPLKGTVLSDSFTSLEEMGIAAEIPTLMTSAVFMADFLKKSGFNIEELYGKDNKYCRIIENLKKSRFCYIGNHGILLYIRCAEKCLGAEDLPFTPPLNIFCFSCITTRTTGMYLSSDEINWRYTDIPLKKSFPLMAIRNGASSFMGLLMFGLELEGDILLFEIVKNMTFFGSTLGDASKEARNTMIGLTKHYLMTIGEKARGNYELIRYYNKITVDECGVYGDPDITLPGEQKDCKDYITEEYGDNIKRITIKINPHDWKIFDAPVGEKSQQVYYTKHYKTLYPEIPYSVLGGSLPVERDNETLIASQNIGFYYFKVKSDIPSGKTVDFIELEDAEFFDAFDFNGNKKDFSSFNPSEFFGTLKFSLSHFKELKEINVIYNWPFSVEEHKDKSIVWFFIPASSVSERDKLIGRLSSAKFILHYSEGFTLKGKVSSCNGNSIDGYLTFTGENGKIKIADTDIKGNYCITLPSGRYSVSIESELYNSLKDEIYIDENMEKNYNMALNKNCKAEIHIADVFSDEPLIGANIIFSSLFGPRDENMIDLYLKGKEKYPHRFFKEFITDSEGNISVFLPEGKYMMDIYRRKDNGMGALYIRQEEYINLEGREVRKTVKLHPGASVLGKIIDRHTGTGIPDSTLLIKVDKGDGKEKNMRFHTDMEGSFSIAVPSGKKLKLYGIFEGYETEEIKEIFPEQGDIVNITLVCRKKV